MAEKATAEPAVKGTNFLDLSREIRYMIYDFAITSREDVYLCTATGTSYQGCCIGLADGVLPDLQRSTECLRAIYNLTNVSHQVRAEIRQTLATHSNYNTFLSAASYQQTPDVPHCRACSNISPYITKLKVWHNMPELGEWLSLQRGKNGQWIVEYQKNPSYISRVFDPRFPASLEGLRDGIARVASSMRTQVGVSPANLKQIDNVPAEVWGMLHEISEVAQLAALRARKWKEGPESELE